MGRHLQLVQLQQLVRGRVRGSYGSTGTHEFALSASLLTAISALQQSNVLRAALSTCRSLYSPSCLQTRTLPRCKRSWTHQPANCTPKRVQHHRRGVCLLVKQLLRSIRRVEQPLVFLHSIGNFFRCPENMLTPLKMRWTLRGPPGGTTPGYTSTLPTQFCTCPAWHNFAAERHCKVDHKDIQYHRRDENFTLFADQ